MPPDDPEMPEAWAAIVNAVIDNMIRSEHGIAGKRGNPRRPAPPERDIPADWP